MIPTFNLSQVLLIHAKEIMRVIKGQQQIKLFRQQGILGMQKRYNAEKIDLYHNNLAFVLRKAGVVWSVDDGLTNIKKCRDAKVRRVVGMSIPSFFQSFVFHQTLEGPSNSDATRMQTRPYVLYFPSLVIGIACSRSALPLIAIRLCSSGIVVSNSPIFRWLPLLL